MPFHARGRRKNFTLIELLVVICIMALLVSLLLPALSRARRSAMMARLQSEKRQADLNSVVEQAAAEAAEKNQPSSRPAAAREVPAPPPPLATVKTFDADVTLTPKLSVGSIDPESIYEAKFTAKLQAVRGNAKDNESEIYLPLPPQIISLSDLIVTVNGKESEAVSLRGDQLVWRGPLDAAAPASFDIVYTAVGRGLYSLQTPPARIIDQFKLQLTANGSDVRMLDLSMQPTALSRLSRGAVYTWDYNRLMTGRTIAVDVLGIAPIDRLGELSWLGPMSVIAFGLVLGVVARAFKLEQFDKWMLLLILGTFTGAFPLMYFAQQFIPLNFAMLLSAGVVLLIISVRAFTMIGARLGLNGVLLPAAVIMGVTLLAAVRPDLQGILLTGHAIALFIVTMALAPRLAALRRSRPAPPIAAAPIAASPA